MVLNLWVNVDAPRQRKIFLRVRKNSMYPTKNLWDERKHNIEIMLGNLNAPNRAKFSISEPTISGLVTTRSLVPISRIKTSRAIRATTWRSDDRSFATVHPPTPWKKTDTVPQRLNLPSARGSKLDLKSRLRRLTNEWPKIRTDGTPVDIMMDQQRSAVTASCSCKVVLNIRGIKHSRWV